MERMVSCISRWQIYLTRGIHRRRLCASHSVNILKSRYSGKINTGAKLCPHTQKKLVMTGGKSELIKALLSAYASQSVQDIQEALTDLLGGTIEK